MFTFTIMKFFGENNKSGVIRWIIYSYFTDCIREYVYYIYGVLYQTQLQLDLKLFFTEKYLKILLLKSNHDWLNCNKSSEINTAINSGVCALIHTLRFSIEIFSPLLQAIGSVLIISMYTGREIIIILVVLVSIFVSGSKLLAWEYYNKKRINKQTNPLKAYNTWLATTILPAILNNRGLKTVKSILSNSTKNDELCQYTRLQSIKWRTMLELFGKLSLLAIIYIMSFYVEVSVLVAINANLYRTYSKMWRLFGMFHSASSNAAEWSSLEHYLKSYVPEPNHCKVPLEKYVISDKIKTHNTEYQLVGKSGSGKSTFMISTVIGLYRKYMGDWLYLDQEMSVPKSSSITIRRFLSNFIEDVDLQPVHLEQTIIKWATFLQLSNIVNSTTLDNSFSTPSGGEVKRLNILQMFLPIFMDQIKIKVLFLDEITSGLDDDTYNIVRRLIEYIKSHSNITIVNIDHHQYNVGQTKVNLIKVRDGVCPWNITGDVNKPQESGFVKSLGDLCIYKTTKTVKKLTFPPEIIVDEHLLNSQI